MTQAYARPGAISRLSMAVLARYGSMSGKGSGKVSNGEDGAKKRIVSLRSLVASAG
jgi:hypothetical protein